MRNKPYVAVNKINKAVILFVVLCFTILQFLSAALLLKHAGHKHGAGETLASCAVCACIHTVNSFFKLTGLFVRTVFCFAVAVLFINVAQGLIFAYNKRYLTPVALKVRLDN